MNERVDTHLLKKSDNNYLFKIDLFVTGSGKYKDESGEFLNLGLLSTVNKYFHVF